MGPHRQSPRPIAPTRHRKRSRAAPRLVPAGTGWYRLVPAGTGWYRPVLEPGQHRRAGADVDPAALLDVEVGDDAVLDDGRVALRALPRPKPMPSITRPIALVKSPLPSASMTMSSPTPWSLPQASITKASLTAMQAMVSTPLSVTCLAVLDEARQVDARAARRERAGHREEHDLALAEQLAGAHRRPGPARPSVRTSTSGTLSPAETDMRDPRRLICSWFSPTNGYPTASQARCFPSKRGRAKGRAAREVYQPDGIESLVEAGCERKTTGADRRAGLRRGTTLARRRVLVQRHPRPPGPSGDARWSGPALGAKSDTIVAAFDDDSPSGLGWLPDGSLLVVAMETQQLRKVDAAGNVTGTPTARSSPAAR